MSPRLCPVRPTRPSVRLHDDDYYCCTLVPPPPEEAKFIFIGIGVSVYNRDMLLRNRLPLVNGICQLILSEESPSEAERPKQDAMHRNRAVRGHEEDVREQAHGVRAKGVDAGDVLPKAHHRRHSVVDDETIVRQRESLPRRRKLSPQEIEELKKKEREEARKEALQKVEEIMSMARVRVQKQYEMSMELARATPGKIRQAAEVQVTKAQEMPGMMMKTARKGLDMGSLLVRYVTDQLSDERDKKD